MSSSSGNGPPSPEVFGEAGKGGVSAINNMALVTCTVASACLTVYADVAGNSAPAATGYVALAGWLGALMLALYFAGRTAGESGFRAALVRGSVMARSNMAFTAIVLLLTAGAAYTTWSRAKADAGNIIAAIRGEVSQVKADAAAIKTDVSQVREDTADIRAVVTREVPPAEQLVRLGFTTSSADVCRALNDIHAEALTLMAQAGVSASAISMPVGGGQHALCIEPLLLEAKGKAGIGAALATLPIRKSDISRMYISQQIGMANPGPVELGPLLRTAGLEPDARARLVYAFATPMMYAVWGGSTDAVRVLLQQGADPNLGARLSVMGTLPVPGKHLPERFTLNPTPLAEARRLGHARIAEALVAAGARAQVTKGPDL